MGTSDSKHVSHKGLGSSRYRTVNLSKHFNAPGVLSTKAVRGQVRWNQLAETLHQRMLRGRQACWGIPFILGPKNLRARGLIVLGPGVRPVEVPLTGRASYICILHFCDRPADPLANTAGGEACAEYEISYRDGSRHAQPIRRRFETNSFVTFWGEGAFAAQPDAMPIPVGPVQKDGWGWYQTGVSAMPGGGAWLYALENPHPERPLASLVLRSTHELPVAVLGVTLYEGPGHPLRHLPRRLYRLVLPAKEKTTAAELRAELDLGVITRLWAVPGKVDQRWVDAPDAGLGTPRKAEKPRRDFLIEATMAEGASLKVKAPKRPVHVLPLGQAFEKGAVRSTDGQARIEALQPSTTWVHVTVVDGQTGKPTPARIHFRGQFGEYLAPYGHHTVVNDRWFEDYGGDLMLGGQPYAYVPGRFQIELPVGEVFVEATRGFEVMPLRQRLEIQPGQRELQLTLCRWTNWRQKGWVTADTHVHFISPQTAWLEGQAEGVNLVNLLASQWGRLFTNVADITGELNGCSKDDTLIWVGTENRHHLLGHMSMLGTRGEPIFPMCAGGPSEAWIGDPDVTLLSEWADRCRQQQGVVIRPHFPFPICEEPVYLLLGKVDGVELRGFTDLESETLDQHCFREWYRYLNCGCRVAAVGGTDKMGAVMPVGGMRTYARLNPDEPFTFENWAGAIRRNATFTTSGPLLEFSVEGKGIGEELHLPMGGGTLEVHAMASSAWPIHELEVVSGGRVVASTSSKDGSHSLEVREKVRIDSSTWLAARCRSRLISRITWPVRLGAHTSPVYVCVGRQEIFSSSDATYMLTLLDGGVTYLDTLSVRYSDERHRAMKALFEKARKELERRLRQT